MQTRSEISMTGTDALAFLLQEVRDFAHANQPFIIALVLLMLAVAVIMSLSRFTTSSR